jgi:hypothetical protein
MAGSHAAGGAHSSERTGATLQLAASLSFGASTCPRQASQPVQLARSICSSPHGHPPCDQSVGQQTSASRGSTSAPPVAAGMAPDTGQSSARSDLPRPTSPSQHLTTVHGIMQARDNMFAPPPRNVERPADAAAQLAALVSDDGLWAASMPAQRRREAAACAAACLALALHPGSHSQPGARSAAGPVEHILGMSAAQPGMKTEGSCTVTQGSMHHVDELPAADAEPAQGSGVASGEPAGRADSTRLDDASGTLHDIAGAVPGSGQADAPALDALWQTLAARLQQISACAAPSQAAQLGEHATAMADALTTDRAIAHDDRVQATCSPLPAVPAVLEHAALWTTRWLLPMLAIVWYSFGHAQQSNPDGQGCHQTAGRHALVLAAIAAALQARGRDACNRLV